MVKNKDVDYFDLEVWEDPVFMLRNEILVYPGRSGRTDLVWPLQQIFADEGPTWTISVAYD